ncbi:bifunctional acetate--CoA ligase family protein/GNAT family N-acetyltransferase [Comamonas sp. NLF-1-9]|uniref:bifunctional acetate--CoA ligase family protein/GNAT family N-acetyltransferase n=1 Tax=Comamonas sp. NLF-1-9 TaxID=2853163 RepID=UPI001C4956D6|nr:bifunctional acetate--CoA ligase family protein/GNAT family N-acetyltransferase [Comamonas sp. NLF-1-9]QXL84792.1 bifunctional acetate--CoA ligase family protein/GNAT family N-acetyltransferase [Comamonas sp. NLF-1-9]
MKEAHYLTPLFAPASLVVFAGERDAPEQLTPQARALHEALRAQRYTGTLQYLDVRTSGTLAELAQTRADLAVIALPPADVPAALAVVGRIRCRSALVLSGGVDEALAQQWRKVARREGIYLLGPNSLGLQRPSLRLNASAVGPLAREGSLGLICQSGALATGMLDWAVTNGVGFSSVISVGPHTDFGLNEALDFLSHDPHTHSIAVYMEGIQNARGFMSALRSAAFAKPVVVLKAGRKPAGNAAAQTHSGAIVGSDEVFDAVLRRAGAVRVRSFVALFSAVKCLASRYRPVGRRLCVVTNGGGPGVLAADWANEIGLELAHLSPETVAALTPELPPLATLSELVDLSEEATPEHYARALGAAFADRQVDGVLAVFSPKFGIDATAVAEATAQARKKANKPLLTSWIGDASVLPAREVLRAAQIPTFRTPEAAVGAFGNIASFHQNQQLLQQTPPPLSNMLKPDIDSARLLIESVLAERRQTLTEMESKTLLAAFQIPVTNTLLARSGREAMMIATQIGFPVALKIDSPDITHKSDVGGVMLNVHSGAAVRDAYEEMVRRVASLQPQARINGVTVQKMARLRRGREVCIGLVTDDPFGPVITFGAGGTMIELIRDGAMELPPLNQFLARRLIQRSRVAETLGEWHGAAAVHVEALEHLLLRVSEMVCALPQLREMDINPIITDETGAIAVDARIVVHEVAAAGGHDARAGNYYGHLAILPYPERYEQLWPLQGGGEYLVRPIRPDDAQMIQRLVRELSPESRYFRFVSPMSELPNSLLARFTLIDYDREMALVAVHQERETGEDGESRLSQRIVGVSRYVANPDHTSCEFALVVADDFANRGVGARLMLSIMDVARERGLTEMQGLVLASNVKMLKLMRRIGFDVRAVDDDVEFKLVVHPL